MSFAFNECYDVAAIKLMRVLCADAKSILFFVQDTHYCEVETLMLPILVTEST